MSDSSRPHVNFKISAYVEAFHPLTQRHQQVPCQGATLYLVSLSLRAGKPHHERNARHGVNPRSVSLPLRCWPFFVVEPDTPVSGSGHTGLRKNNYFDAVVHKHESPPRKRFLAGWSSPFMQLIDHPTAFWPSVQALSARSVIT